MNIQRKNGVFDEQLNLCRQQVLDYLIQPKFQEMFSPETLRAAVYSYIERMGKAMRPALVMWAAGATGGETRIPVALPAAAAIEVFHAYTLVHDDIIDRDVVRRGGPTVHTEYEQVAQNLFKLNQSEATHYGMSIGLLAGDTQLCWSVSILTDYLLRQDVTFEVMQSIIKQVTDKLFLIVPSGELLDINLSLTNIENLTAQQILDMYYRKTGVTFEIAARIGAVIGLNALENHEKAIENLSEFARLSGLAFQLHDDILGLIGNPADTRKPVGADIREGKHTFTVIYTLEQVDQRTKETLIQILGNRNATDDEISQVISSLEDVGAISYTRQVASDYLDQALSRLSDLPESNYRDLLKSWATYTIARAG
jgi:geranylgeranyl diphosphate synthase type I